MISHANNPAKPSQLVSVPHLFTPNEGPYIRSGSSPNSPAPRPSSSLRPPSGAPKPAPPPTSRQVASVTADLPLSTRLICPFVLSNPPRRPPGLLGLLRQRLRHHRRVRVGGGRVDTGAGQPDRPDQHLVWPLLPHCSDSALWPEDDRDQEVQ